VPSDSTSGPGRSVLCSFRGRNHDAGSRRKRVPGPGDGAGRRGRARPGAWGGAVGGGAERGRRP
jgi:hypothetical protein